MFQPYSPIDVGKFTQPTWRQIVVMALMAASFLAIGYGLSFPSNEPTTISPAQGEALPGVNDGGGRTLPK